MYNPKTINSFERRMREMGCLLLPKQFTRYGDILLAERSIMEGAEKYYETYWMLSRDGIDFGRCVRNSWAVPHTDRVAEAVEDAQSWIDANVRNNRYE